jgi:hypothetical protein
LEKKVSTVSQKNLGVAERAHICNPKAGSTLAANSRGINRFLTTTKKNRLVAW